MNKPHINQTVLVNAFARLHMGFLDLNGSQGRRFGSLGLGLNAPDTLIELAVGNQMFGDVLEPSYVKKSKEKILKYTELNAEISIKVHREIPRHFGLGSGTQMALAVGSGINALLGTSLTPQEVASITGRGLRSGIGIGTFEGGGLVLDGGSGAETIVPPIIMQQDFPEEWQVLLIFDYDYVGIHGDEEIKAFASLKDANLAETQQINHQILMRAMPALKERDLVTFGKAIGKLQAYTGDYFAPAQGGRYASKLVTQVLNDLLVNGVHCVGQSSWGPTGFAIFENKAIAEEHLTRLQSTYQQNQLSLLLCRAHNASASIMVKTKA